MRDRRRGGERRRPRAADEIRDGGGVRLVGLDDDAADAGPSHRVTQFVGRAVNESATDGGGVRVLPRDDPHARALTHGQRVVGDDAAGEQTVPGVEDGALAVPGVATVGRPGQDERRTVGPGVEVARDLRPRRGIIDAAPLSAACPREARQEHERGDDAADEGDGREDAAASAAHLGVDEQPPAEGRRDDPEGDELLPVAQQPAAGHVQDDRRHDVTQPRHGARAREEQPRDGERRDRPATEAPGGDDAGDAHEGGGEHDGR